MKKIISTLLLISVALSASLLLWSCGETEPAHEHDYIGGICSCGEIDPTYRDCDMCITARGTHPIDVYGYTYYLCDSCYDYYTHEHNFVNGKCECGEEDLDYGNIGIPADAVDADGNLTITLSNGSSFPAVALPENKEGIKFSNAELSSGRMVIYFSDGYMLNCTHYNVAEEEITSLDAKIENKHLILTVNGKATDLGQVFYPTMPLSEMTASGACEYADLRDTEGRNTAIVEMKIKGYGTITILLDATTAPITVQNFLSLAKSGFYDGLTFHRVMTNFMIQGGDPSANGSGGSGTTIKGEFSANGWANDISHIRGVISMARLGGDNDSATSQFFICNADATASLDGQYAAFGYVISGMNIVDEITSLTIPYADAYSNYTISDKDKQAVIESVTVISDLKITTNPDVDDDAWTGN